MKLSKLSNTCKKKMNLKLKKFTKLNKDFKNQVENCSDRNSNEGSKIDKE